MSLAKSELFFGRFSCRTGLVECVECAEYPPRPLAIDIDLGDESGSVPDDTRTSCFTGGSGSGIFCILDKICFGDVRPSIVGSVSIDVVNHRRPAPFLNRKGYSVGIERSPVERAKQVAIGTNGRECWFTGASRVPLPTSGFRVVATDGGKVRHGARDPSQRTRFSVIFDPIAKVFNVGHLMLSHIASPKSVVVRAARCSSTVAARLVSTRITFFSQAWGLA